MNNLSEREKRAIDISDQLVKYSEEVGLKADRDLEHGIDYICYGNSILSTSYGKFWDDDKDIITMDVYAPGDYFGSSIDIRFDTVSHTKRDIERMKMMLKAIDSGNYRTNKVTHIMFQT